MVRRYACEQRGFLDLGLIRRDGPNGKTLVISNDIYKEVIPRELTSVTQDNLVSRAEQPWYVASDGHLDMPKLMRDFQRFFRENIESWIDGFDYKEAGFQLLLQAFMQRIVNGGGIIEREYALGRGSVDLLARWRYPKEAPRGEQTEQRILLELKTIRKSRSPETVLREALEQYRATRTDRTQPNRTSSSATSGPNRPGTRRYTNAPNTATDGISQCRGYRS